MPQSHRHPRPRTVRFVAFGTAVLLSIGFAACGGGKDKVTVGLITKRDSNPFFVKTCPHASSTRLIYP